MKVMTENIKKYNIAAEVIFTRWTRDRRPASSCVSGYRWNLHTHTPPGGGTTPY